MQSQYSTWEDFFLQFLRLMHVYACRLTRRVEDADDLVNDTVVRILRSRRQPSELDEPIAWVFLIMKRIWIDHLRKAKRAHFESIDDPERELQRELPGFDPTVHRDLENKNLLDAIRQKTAKLTARERLLLELMSEGMTCEEIAELLNEDLRITRYDCNALKAKLKYRFRGNNF